MLLHRTSTLENRDLTVNAINCPEQPCNYFATLSEDTKAMEKQARPQVELLVNHISDYHHCMLFETLEETIKG